MRRFKVGSTDVGARADVFVASKYPDFARSALSGLFDNKLVTINSKAAKSGQKLRLGDELKVDDKLLKSEPALIELPILYEDADVVVMNKPAGMLTHSKGALNTEATVASFLKTKLTDNDLSGNRAGIVHRLDRPTSGVIIGAKHNKALKDLQKQFSARKTAKTYLAIIEGVPKTTEAIIDAPIERNPKRPQTFRVSSSGKSAQTRYKVLSSFKKAGKSYSRLNLKPVTGRTHQLRVHLAYIGHPIVGDFVYGHDGPALLLHAAALELKLPNGQKKAFKVSEPASFKEFSDG